MHACLKQMTLDLELRGLAKHTKSEYLRYARLFAAYHDRSPEDMGEREIQQFLLHRLVDDKVSHATLKVTVAALRFLYATTLKRPEIAVLIAYPKVKSALPDVLSGSEVNLLLQALREPKYRAIVMTTYGAGLRISEVCTLCVKDVNSKLPAATSTLHNAPPGDGAPRDFRELLLALTGVDLRHCSRCGAFALVRLPLEPPAAPGATAPPSPASTSPPPDTS